MNVRNVCGCALGALPSPDSDGLVGEGEGRFPLGGLSDTAHSLQEEMRKEKKNQHLSYGNKD